MTAPEGVSRAKRAKELEPLQDAWDEWIHARKVGLIRYFVSVLIGISNNSSYFEKQRLFSVIQTLPCAPSRRTSLII
jgi:hypothetical protein